jgi:hypothetical protein
MSRNAQTALLLALVAVVSFCGIVAKYWILNG